RTRTRPSAEIENAHKAVGGTKPGRRFLTQQLNYAYTMLLPARFPGFARALHAQSADAIALGANDLRPRPLSESVRSDCRTAH
ncbi:MAG: hypothetical protein WBV77_05450, partial [Solirubrobacteraceae bacterium]